MQIVLSILLGLGWILLAVLAVLLLVLLIVLFHPIHYVVDIHWLEENWAKLQGHWLFHLIQAKVRYADDLVYGEIKLFFKTHTFSLDLTEKKEKKEEEEDADEKSSDASQGKRTASFEALPKLKRILTDEKNKAAVIHLKDELLYLVKVLLPRKSKVDVIYSTGAPDTTGQAFGVLACFPAMYQKNWHIVPDFAADAPYLTGTIWGKGRIYGYEIVGIILRIIYDKNCTRLYTTINRFIKWFKKSNHGEEK